MNIHVDNAVLSSKNIFFLMPILSVSAIINCWYLYDSEKSKFLCEMMENLLLIMSKRWSINRELNLKMKVN